MTKILIVEDDYDISHMIKELLRLNGMEGVIAKTGEEGALLLDSTIDLILLDLMLPGKSGKEWITKYKEKQLIPVIVMTAISQMEVKLNLFALGADDYITKPFHNEELLARIKVWMRQKKAELSQLQYKDLILYPDLYQAFCCDQPLNLSKLEFELLQTLMKNPRQVFTKNYLFDTIWKEDYADDNTLNVHISKIRAKLKEISPETYIDTVWSIGYKMH